MADFVIKHTNELEHPWPKWILGRKSLGLSSFGMNITELQPGEQIPEHNEVERAQEEVFLTLVGLPTIVINGKRHPAPEGTFVRLDPKPKRYVVNDGKKVARLLIISAPTTSGYQPLDWA